jgi:TPR repeat/Family of unknown function (DUF6165)/Tetratricopeptide repeat
MAKISEALAIALQHHRAGRVREAEQIYRQILAVKPNHVDALNLVGVCASQMGQHEVAIKCIGQAIQLNAAVADFHNNLGEAHRWLGALPEAIACYRQALELKPDYAEAICNLGNAYNGQGKLDDADVCYRKALELNPELAEAHFDRARLWLLTGDWQRGWQEYEWRWRMKGVAPRRFVQPLWDGTSLIGKTILLHAEQGLGDTIQFVRYASIVKALGGRVLVECQQQLLGLLEGCSGINQLLGHGNDLPAFDVHAPLMSVPGILKNSIEAVPAPIPYLVPKPALVEQWRERLSEFDGFKIGISWQGNPTFLGDRVRSIPLRQFAPLTQVPRVSLISLQKGAGVEQLAEVRDLFPVADLGSDFDQQSGPFMDTAAVMRNLDLVITTDSAVAHLAGALGVAVWVALPFAPDWRWQLHRSDSPWYPTMRLYRQSTLGDWSDVFARMAAALATGASTPGGNEMAPKTLISIHVAAGELIDKITILEIKADRIDDADKLRHVWQELEMLRKVRDGVLEASPQLTELTSQLKSINLALWQIEDAIRLCERNKEFGSQFIELARSVYHQNDQRFQVKRQINELVGSSFVEEKSYAAYE